jgi:hypothetical protein
MSQRQLRSKRWPTLGAELSSKRRGNAAMLPQSFGLLFGRLGPRWIHRGSTATRHATRKPANILKRSFRSPSVWICCSILFSSVGFDFCRGRDVALESSTDQARPNQVWGMAASSCTTPFIKTEGEEATTPYTRLVTSELGPGRWGDEEKSVPGWVPPGTRGREGQDLQRGLCRLKHSRIFCGSPCGHVAAPVKI